jgi:hypothetical protein
LKNPKILSIQKILKGTHSLCISQLILSNQIIIIRRDAIGADIIYIFNIKATQKDGGEKGGAMMMYLAH